eukprot:CAMPEP_0201283670 /NCGR_PEP_ID=MMETSP1317-20130820/38178_1 /ASSEMBLY_ACC=CAM_ASM_000770 /TAXON_ID=187299 /ORGANISM="Undescribed Undescribed, Strain Undescribed" /LENGTH=46 /DNA_ID= /DNA_START= /DNA_END= /DNA_ORIENTATION=
MHGEGEFTWPDGSSFDGLWGKNVRNGFGVFIGQDGQSLQGEWLNGK